MGSVWLKEVDKGLKDLITNTIKCYNENRELTTVPVIITHPEKESGKKLTYPCVCISNYNQRIDMQRINRERVVHRDKETGVALVSKHSVPYSLFYQIDIYARYQIDIDEMTRRWLGNIEDHHLLEVVDTEGITRHSEMTQVHGCKVLDSVEDSKRLFRRSYSYRISVDLDESTAKEVKLVLETHINGGVNKDGSNSK